jgi:hypothetical protein
MIYMGICFVLNDFDEGGAERSVKALLVQLRTYERVDPLLIVADGSGELRSEFLASGTETVSVGIDLEISTVPRRIALLAAELRTPDVDIVDSHSSFSHLISRVACAGLSVPHVSTYRNVDAERAYVESRTDSETILGPYYSRLTRTHA